MDLNSHFTAQASRLDGPGSLSWVVPIFDKVIDIQQKSVRYYRTSSVVFVVLGVASSVVFYALDKTSVVNLEEFIKLGPSLIGTGITAYQYSKIAGCRERIVSYSGLNDCISRYDQMPDDGRAEIRIGGHECLRQVNCQKLKLYGAQRARSTGSTFQDRLE